MKITEEQIQKVNQVINSLYRLLIYHQAQEIVKILNESSTKRR